MSFMQSLLRWFTPLEPATHFTAHVHWVAGGLNPHNLPIFTAHAPVLITAAIGRVEVPSGHEASLTLVRVSNGTAMSAARPVTTAMDIGGAAQTNQVLDLTPDTENLLLQSGDSIGVQTTGLCAGGAGGITVFMVSQEVAPADEDNFSYAPFPNMPAL